MLNVSFTCQSTHFSLKLVKTVSSSQAYSLSWGKYLKGYFLLLLHFPPNEVAVPIPAISTAHKSLSCCLNLTLSWIKFCRSQMISAEDCEFIKKFEVANSDEKQAILTAEGHQVDSSQKLIQQSLNTGSHISANFYAFNSFKLEKKIFSVKW